MGTKRRGKKGRWRCEQALEGFAMICMAYHDYEIPDCHAAQCCKKKYLLWFCLTPNFCSLLPPPCATNGP